MSDKFINIAKPLSRENIRNIATLIRKRFIPRGMIHFPVWQLMEFMMHLLDPMFEYDILAVSDMPNCYAKAIPALHTIQIREDVYEAILKGDPRHRFTLAHEIGHYILHINENITVLNRLDPQTQKMPKCYDTEWQANTFAGELLVPFGEVCELTIEEITINCGVSRKVAEIQATYNKHK